MSASTKSTSEPVENEDGQTSHVAVSEENLAALLRATTGPGQPEAQPPEDPGAAAPAAPTQETSAPPPPETPASKIELAPGAPTDVVESRLALFAALKEHRSTILRSVETPATPALEQPPDAKQDAKLDVSPAPAAAPHQNPPSPLPEVAPVRNTPLQAKPPVSTPIKPASIPSSNVANPQQSQDGSRNRLFLGLIAGGVLAVVGILAFVAKSHSSKAAPTVVAPASTNSVPLQVQAELLGNGVFDVRWNAQSTSIAQAREGRLFITERDRSPQIVVLNPQQLAEGHVSYHSSAEGLQFQLEIVDRSGKISEESAFTLSSKPPPVVASVVPAPAASSENPAKKAENIPAPSKVTDAVQPAQAVQAPPSRPAPRAFTAPPTNRVSNVQVPAITVEPPPIAPNMPALPTALSQPTILTSPVGTAVSQPAAAKPVRVGGSLQAASLIKSVPPRYPAIAMSNRIQGTVRFTALIGKDGSVRSLQAISGNQVLIPAATDAVKQWIYRPTLLNGEPVEVITQIDVNFTLK